MPELEAVGAEFASSAAHIVKVERIIDATRHDIWDVITETATWTAWFPTMSRAESVNQRATLGSTRTVKVGLLVAEEQIVVADEPARWGFTVVRTNLPIATQMLELLDLEDVGSPERPRTRVIYTGAFAPTWFTRPLFRLTKRSVATTWRHGLDGLATHLAGSGQ